MSSQDIKLLEDMGFSRERIDRALSFTGNAGLEPAMDWLLAHADEPIEPAQSDPPPGTLKLCIPSEQSKKEEKSEEVEAEASCPEENSGEPSVSADGSAEMSAKSLKCDECNKLFATQLEVEYHAAKSGHSSFSESVEEKKPLTEEEKKEQLKKIEEKLKQKRKEREEQEKKDALEREKMRIRSGKEIVAAKKRIEEEEMKKIVELRKREKMEEKLARQRVKDQIEEDKAARRKKFGMGGGAAPEPAPPTPAPTASPCPAPAQRNYNETKLQIRLTNGEALTQTFGAKEQLSAVRLYVEMNRTDLNGPFSLMTPFPRKVFTDEDYEKPLDILGLVPSAVVIVTKTN
ncbi:UBX domain-containing protein 1-B [Ischnura elegans]|uniref:UBX domain-containing protein 1-B n=1 Tax=Ischnura elegans TaxID=197161 RepID=UPI001ED88F46|nr:UBX domain-containing protein 1-B [Ischnura elegans]